MTKTIRLTTQNARLITAKKTCIQALGEHKKWLSGIDFEDFASIEHGFIFDYDTAFFEDGVDEDAIEAKLNKIVSDWFKTYRYSLLLWNVVHLELDEEETVTYDTYSFEEAELSDNEQTLLKKFAAFANIPTSDLTLFIAQESKPLTCLHDLLALGSNELEHHRFTLGVPKYIKSFIEDHFLCDRYATYSLRDIDKKLQTLLDDNKYKDLLTYDYGLLSDLMKSKFGSMKYDW